MKLELFINFNGNCRQAVEFYAKVFKSEVGNLMTYGQAPPCPEYPLNPADTDKVCYAGVVVGDATLMFMDMPTGSPLIVGNNISPTLSMGDKAEVQRITNELAENGTIVMPLQPTFFSELYGMVTDQFGITWQVLYYERAMQ